MPDTTTIIYYIWGAVLAAILNILDEYSLHQV